MSPPPLVLLGLVAWLVWPRRSPRRNPRRRPNPRKPRAASAFSNEQLADLDVFYAQALRRAEAAIASEQRAREAYLAGRLRRREYADVQQARDGALGVLRTQRRHAEQRYERTLQGRLFNPRRRPILPNLDAFYDERGRIRPIRGSEGYDEEIERFQRELRREQGREDFYADVGTERLGRLGGGVDRPPWAVGLSNAQLERIAREYGQRASTEGWWERAGLVSGTGELRMLLREGGYKQERTRTHRPARRAARGRPHELSRAEVIAERSRQRALASRSATSVPGSDLPF